MDITSAPPYPKLSAGRNGSARGVGAQSGRCARRAEWFRSTFDLARRCTVFLRSGATHTRRSSSSDSRRPRRLIPVVVPRKLITNLRAKVVYQPVVLERLRHGFEGFNVQWSSREQVEAMLAGFRSMSDASIEPQSRAIQTYAMIHTDWRLSMAKAIVAKRPAGAGRQASGRRRGWVRKNMVMDQRKLDVARRALGVDTETETIDRALDFVAFREELAEGFAAVRRSGGVEDVFERRKA